MTVFIHLFSYYTQQETGIQLHFDRQIVHGRQTVVNLINQKGSEKTLVSCPAPSLEEEGSGDTRGFFVTDWNAISSEWAGFLSRNRKNDVVKLP